jgi:hypothetical protein
MKHIPTFENFLNEGDMTKEVRDGGHDKDMK